MAKALSDVQLSDQSKLCLLRGGALNPLLKFLGHGDMKMKMVAIEALLNLSTVAQNGLMMIKEGAVEPLFELLFCDAVSPLLCEKVASILMHLSLSRIGEDAGNGYIPFLESQEQIFKLFSLVSLCSSEAQQSILRTFYAMCQCPVSGYNVRTRLRKVCFIILKNTSCICCHNPITKFCYHIFSGSTPSSLAHDPARPHIHIRNPK